MYNCSGLKNIFDVNRKSSKLKNSFVGLKNKLNVRRFKLFNDDIYHPVYQKFPGYKN